MIIGLCGVAGSGKSTVADFLVRDHGFVSIALADPIKRAAKDWFAFTDRQLWGPSEARNEPDRRYLVNAGYADAVAEQKRAYTFARQNGNDASAEEHLRLARSYAKEAWLTPRRALQVMGTEVGRSCYRNVWVEHAMRVANQLLRKDYAQNEGVWRYSPYEGLFRDKNRNYTGFPELDNLPLGVVISDVRFRNEVLAIRDVGGEVWRLTRPSSGLTGDAAKHQSETEQNEIDSSLFGSFIDNRGTLEDLERATGDAVHEALRAQQEQLRSISKK